MHQPRHGLALMDKRKKFGRRLKTEQYHPRTSISKVTEHRKPPTRILVLILILILILVLVLVLEVATAAHTCRRIATLRICSAA
jgi:amino acid transporter